MVNNCNYVRFILNFITPDHSLVATFVNMIKIEKLIGIMSLVALASCSQSADTKESDKDTLVQTVEVLVEKENSTTTTTKTTTTKTNDDGTTIEVDENGVAIGSQNGGNTTKVKVTTDSTKIKIIRK